MPGLLMPTPEPLGTAVFLVLALSIAGIAHVAWLKSRYTQRWEQPLDAGLTWRGKRLFGPHKMLRGLMMLPPAAALSFLCFSLLRPVIPEWLHNGMWPLSHLQYVMLGFSCGLVFMLAELPNSFIKRQFGIGSGQTAQQPLLRRVFLILDRIDSELGVLLLLSLILPLAPATWGWTLLLGSGLHAGFSYILYKIKIKDRAL